MCVYRCVTTPDRQVATHPLDVAHPRAPPQLDEHPLLEESHAFPMTFDEVASKSFGEEVRRHGVGGTVARDDRLGLCDFRANPEFRH